MKWFLEAVCGGVDWIEVTQDRIPWEVFVNMAIELLVSMQYFGEVNNYKVFKGDHFISHCQIVKFFRILLKIKFSVNFLSSSKCNI